MLERQDRIKSLDGLRAFAIILVLLCHCAWRLHKLNTPITLKLGMMDIHNLFYNGWVGVELFFVLSGFLITSQLLTKSILQGNLKEFFFKRFFRIAPPYYVSVIIALIYFHIAPKIEDMAFSELLYIWWWPLMSHFIFLHDLIGRLPIIDGLFWSIPIEIKFYIILPLMVFLLSKVGDNLRRIYIILAVYSLYLILKVTYIYTQYGFDTVTYINYFLYVKSPFYFALEGLITGVLCAFIIRHKNLKKIPPQSPILHTMFAVGIVLFLFISLQNHFTDPPYYIATNATFFEMAFMPALLSLSFGLIVISSIKGCFVTTFLESNFLKFIAQISYSLYLTHIFALPVLGLYGFMAFTPTLWLISIPSYLILSACFACLLHVFIEKPFLDWSKNKFQYT